MTVERRHREGTIPFRGHRTWFRVVGEGEEPGRLPVLMLHGGPGAPSDYLEPYEDLAATGRRVIFYDQLGAGHSVITEPHDPSMWTVELFVDEVAAVREGLGLDRVHVVGQSWGGMLGMAYAITRPAGLASLVNQSGPASIPAFTAGARALLKGFPPPMQAAIDRLEAAGDYGAEYQAAIRPFYLRHVCRLDPWPEYVVRTFARLEAAPEVYMTMNGPSEFNVVGVIKDFDVTPRLGRISVPTLILSGRHDEVVPDVMRSVHDGIAGSRWVLFEDSSHMCHVEERQRCMATVAAFLDEVERSATPAR